MKRLATIVLCLSTPFFVKAQQIIKGVPSPESIVAYKDGYFVSSIGEKLEPIKKDGDGAIAFVDKSGKVKSPKYFDEVLNAPKGIDIVGSRLYVADIDHVKGFDIVTKKKIFDLDLEKSAKLLNDIFIVNENLLLVTDSFTGDVLSVNLSNGTTTKLGVIAGANGILYDRKSDLVYVCSMGEQMKGQGKLFTRKLKDNGSKFTEVSGSPVGLFDGIVQLEDGNIVLSDWQNLSGEKAGFLVTYNPATKEVTRKEVKHGPADIALDKANRKLLIPQLLDSEIVVVGLPK
ncbi:hypothetical protein DVR12_10955 [Chitinophaga silvatica]|uniref:ATP-binding protein n=1 Tax=Chitinophaga silvatica TaxID=2282649 RepID=A0A3E1YCK0_9BACT|nr:hypothetical protein [Chitinophaga silvatica]RFS23524.1 hypothetical protein DVR12_10955 [Chitinophaga silvatica]